ncbi:unnamed protein product [marine sediment metagenome]|uniref:Uncharacterized protein n=1 Tax=marine sediment metagenome TaxID=412755 RepID=X0V062_9ZZZZ|nr:hypothetical protein [Salmonella enterica subsp. enterica serovar Istanbul]
MNAVEDLEPELGAHLARHASLGPSREDAANELGDRCEQPADREPEHRISASEILKDPDGSSVHRARAPGQRARENSTCGREQRVAGCVHQRPDDDGESERGMRQNQPCCPGV